MTKEIRQEVVGGVMLLAVIALGFLWFNTRFNVAIERLEQVKIEVPGII